MLLLCGCHAAMLLLCVCLLQNYSVSSHNTRSCAALRAADLDWIVGPECSLGGKEEGVQGRNKQKRDTRGVTTDLLDV